MIDNKYGQMIIKVFIYTSLIILITLIISILGFIVINGIKLVNASFLNEMFPSIISTFLLVITTLLIVIPTGVLSALYLQVYSNNSKLVNSISFAINCLAQMPSIVYGLFAVSLFLYFFKLERSILIGAITMACVILPVVIKNVENAIKMVSKKQIEASYALGASTYYAIIKVIIPESIRGIITAITLSIGRIIGDVAAVLFVIGTVDRIPESILDPGITLASKLYLILQEPSFSKVGIGEAYAIALVLVVIVIIINIVVKIMEFSILKE